VCVCVDSELDGLEKCTADSHCESYDNGTHALERYIKTIEYLCTEPVKTSK